MQLIYDSPDGVDQRLLPNYVGHLLFIGVGGGESSDGGDNIDNNSNECSW